MKKILRTLMVLLVLVGAGYLLVKATTSGFEELEQTQQKEKIKLDVPLENQFDGDALANGCEVTALSMLLRYYGYHTTKNQLADDLDYQPLYTESGNHGDPHLGFVGDITGGDEAMGVAVEPIAKVAKEYVGADYQVIAKKKMPFDKVINVVASGKPVWIIATVDFQVPTNNDFLLWETDQGSSYVTPLIHSAVITGFDREKKVVYVNDPYGYKNRKVSWSDLEKVYQETDQQSLYLKKA